jgi:phosphohistidine phosphatase SixA
MPTLLLIRHALAEERENWTRPDLERPLTHEGRRQADAIAARVQEQLRGSLKGEKLQPPRTSPALRCRQTLQPLTEALGVRLVADDGLMEGQAIAVPSDAGVHALCAHGDNIPELLDRLGIDWDGRCKKASIWTVRLGQDNQVVEASYWKP